jgi:PAS domain S-box-containing protein
MAEACSSNSPVPRGELSFIPGGSEMAERIRSFDWSKTSIGEPQRWPQSLKTAVSICTGSRYPIVIWWGKEALTQFYNDAYISFLGATKHPRALGQSARECWSEIWHIIEPMLEGVFATGEATWSEDFLYVITRNLPREEGYFTFSYSAIRDDTGSVGGIFCACYETTGRVIGERRLQTLRDLGRVAMEAKSAAQACQITAQTLARNSADIPFALIYLRDPEGRQVRLVAKTGLEAGSPAALDRIELRKAADQQGTWPLGSAFDAAAVEQLSDIVTRFGPLPGGPWPESPRDALILPIAAPGLLQPTGFLVVGLSPRRVVDAEYRSFFELIAGHLASAIANARAYEAEKQRAEALAEIDGAKTAFFSNVSHEFRTPLTLILGPLQDTLATPGLPPAAYEQLGVARRNGQRLHKLVNTLLDFSRIEVGRAEAVYEPLDLATYTAELAGVFRSAIESAGMMLIVECPPLPGPIYADREMWEKVVYNLLSNAFKFTFEGTITVAVRQVAEGVELTVSDTGTGIPADELPHIFERFYRAKVARGRSYEGSGIGLALVQELVKLHGGSVHVSSKIGQGSAFTIRLPTGNAHLPADRIGAAPTRASTSPRGDVYLEEALQWLPNDRRPFIQELATERSPTLQGSRILLADDNADMREYLRRLLTQSGCHVVAVGDGEAAIDALQETPFDLVLADVMMPKGDGFNVVAALRRSEHTQSTPVILLSARAGEEARIEGMAAGADDYLAKPFSARELVARVEAHLKLGQLRREDQQRAAADLDAMARLRDLAELCAATHSLEESPLDAILDTAIAIAGADKGNIQLLDSDSGTLRIAAHRGFEEPFLSFFASVDAGEPAVCGAALQARGRVIVEDVMQSAIFAGQPSRQVLLDADVRAVQSTPLTSSAGLVFGMISTHFRVSHRPSERDLRLLDLVARQAANYLERKEAETTQAQLAAIVGSASDAIIAKTLAGIVTSWNAAAERLFGYAAHEMIGQSIRRVIPAERQHEEDTILRRLAAGERIEHYDTVRVVKDGRAIDVSLTISPMRDAAGRIIGASKIARDITERKRAESLLRRQADLLDNSHEAIFVWKVPGGITYWSRGAEVLYGYTREEAIGSVSHELLHTQAPVPLTEIEAQVTSVGSWRGELKHTARDGRTLTVESQHVRVIYDGEAYALETNRDITEMKARQERIELLMHELNHRSKNILSLVQSIARQTSGSSYEDFMARFSRRLQALAANQDLLVENEWRGVAIHDLARAQLAPFADLGQRFFLEGPLLSLAPAAAQGVGLALHELATNAGKYGALANAQGRVDVAWACDGGTFSIGWTERNGPPVEPPQRRGFGSTVITSLAEMSVDGSVDLQYRTTGLTWRLTCAADKALELGAGPTQLARAYRPRSAS